MNNQSQSLGIALSERIRQDILFGRLAPGEKLRLKMLSERYDCGASPIREALNQLTTDGWVVRIDKRGFFVSDTSRTEFDDILRNRCFMEGEALRLSIERGDAAWEERVLLSHHRLRQLKRPGDPTPVAAIAGWEEAHKDFHMSLISGCGSPFLIATCDKLYYLNIRYRHMARSKSQRSRTVASEHEQITDLALSRKTEEAVGALQEHYMVTGRFLFDE
ncbi:GntR family transcriptional regulator [Halovulum dunhuangense]|uniref:GntR family transcriptional regulator n=1 Tax=Halovulum dunhuangense TaxID=1505036 RepID=A0A849L1F3_9RHOB|nr:GntR family transcriptional regulator [Halovulum dunhuangense]NNU80090.1 GntR family transcriptional regulator [Halovulum dunhuangense]